MGPFETFAKYAECFCALRVWLQAEALGCKEAFLGDVAFDDFEESNFELNVVRKGVDTRIGFDIASPVCKKQASQIVLIVGDSVRFE